jgi:ankyrin repeat protein
VTVSNKDRLMPLNSASDSRYISIVKLLLEKGTDMMVTNKDR